MTPLVVLTEEGGFFGQTRRPWVSLDIGTLCRHVERAGREVRRFTFQDVATRAVDIHDSAVFYAFSQKENTRRYITDVVWHLAHGSNLLIPSFDLLMCHENKGYQELFRRQRGLPGLRSAYVVDSRQAAGLDMSFPLVVKTVDGSNSDGVFLARNRSDLLRIAGRLEPRVGILARCDLIRRKYFRRPRTYRDYPEYTTRQDYLQYREFVVPRRRLVVQEFIPGLEYDFRVLAMGDRYFVMRRRVVSGDFRASGTKLFDFDSDVPIPLLDFARAAHSKVDAPFLSMDICPHGDGWALLEFQALHFGVSALKRGRGCFMRAGERWQFTAGVGDVEAEMARALVAHLAAAGSTPA
ncbi:MAG: hypothetical protein MUE60_11030 [Candidatus Eisenbacteria bacterium]|nr:hypothetical protein [Candidatus Eisenbacteria bacterium]